MNIFSQKIVQEQEGNPLFFDNIKIICSVEYILYNFLKINISCSFLILKFLLNSIIQ